MPRPLSVIYAETTPLEMRGDEATQAWVRATEILLRAKARRDARLQGSLTNEESSISIKRIVNDNK